MVCNVSSFVSWQEPDPISLMTKQGQLRGATESTCGCSQLLSVFLTSVTHSRPERGWKVMGFESTVSTALLQRTTRIKYLWQKNIKQGKKTGNRIKRNQMSTSGCSSEHLRGCSVYLESCWTQSQMHINLQFNIYSNPGKKKETNSCMFITQEHRNVPSQFFWQSKKLAAPSVSTLVSTESVHNAAVTIPHKEVTTGS